MSSPGVNICFPLAWSGSAALPSGCSRLSATPRCIIVPPGPAFPGVKFGNFGLKKKNQSCTGERGSWSICETEQLLGERHRVSVCQDAHPQAAWMEGDLPGLWMGRPFTGPLHPQLPLCFSIVPAVLPHVPTSFFFLK